jgi:hypothetical protein
LAFLVNPNFLKYNVIQKIDLCLWCAAYGLTIVIKPFKSKKVECSSLIFFKKQGDKEKIKIVERSELLLSPDPTGFARCDECYLFKTLAGRTPARSLQGCIHGVS